MTRALADLTLAGMRRERREVHAVAEALHRSGGWLDGFGYAMLAEEWQAGPDCRRARLG